MLQRVDVGTQTVGNYRGERRYDAIVALRDLRGAASRMPGTARDATPYGGGVAEILRSEIPLLRDLGLVADWKLISGNDAFFAVTKAIHNGLQGAPEGLGPDDEKRYLAQSAHNAQLLDEKYDLIIVHDPQPLALRELHDGRDARWIWRCHIDTSEPNTVRSGDFLPPFLVRYDAAVFTLGGFVPPEFPVERVEIIPPAIDPESPKNLELGSELANRVLEWIGVDTTRPLITQISRFDPWKDPLGVIAAYRLVRQQVPDAATRPRRVHGPRRPARLGHLPPDPRAARDDPDIHLFTNLTGVGNIEVNAFQRLAQVVIQKSLREGFGLVVSESLWKGTPVVAGRAGGIPLQLQDGVGGFLVDSVEECATGSASFSPTRNSDTRSENGGGTRARALFVDPPHRRRTPSVHIGAGCGAPLRRAHRARRRAPGPRVWIAGRRASRSPAGGRWPRPLLLL